MPSSCRLLKRLLVISLLFSFLLTSLIEIPVASAASKNLVAAKTTNAWSGVSCERNIAFVNGWYVYVFFENASYVGLYSRTSSDGVTWGHEQLIDSSAFGLADAGLDVDDDRVSYVFVGWANKSAAGVSHRHYLWKRGLVNATSGVITWGPESTVYHSVFAGGGYDCGKIAISWNPTSVTPFYASGMDDNAGTSGVWYLEVYKTINNGTSWTQLYKGTGHVSYLLHCRYLAMAFLATTGDDMWLYVADYYNPGVTFFFYDGAVWGAAQYHLMTNNFQSNALKDNIFCGAINDNNITYIAWRRQGLTDLYVKRHITMNNTWLAEFRVDQDPTQIDYVSIGSRSYLKDWLVVYIRSGKLYTRQIFSNYTYGAVENTWGTSFTGPQVVHTDRYAQDILSSWHENSMANLYFAMKEGITITVHFYHNGNGHFYVDGLDKANATILYYPGNLGISLAGVPHINYTLSYFLANSTHLNDNPYSYTVTASVNLWAIFAASGGAPTPLSPVARWNSTLLAYIETIYTLSGSMSLDPDGGSVAFFSWDFGDGNVTAGNYPTITHEWTTVGVKTVVLNVTDSDDGLTDTFTISVLVVDWRLAPVSRWNATLQAVEDVSYLLNGSVSLDPDGGTITTYSWDFDDGNVTSGNFPIVHHTWAVIGTYHTTLTVTDSDNALTETFYFTVLAVSAGGVAGVNAFPVGLVMGFGFALPIGVGLSIMLLRRRRGGYGY